MKILIMLLIFMLSVMTGPGPSRATQKEDGKTMAEGMARTRIATFAGGCFWCTEADFEKVPGVVNVVSGYTGGHKENPSYMEVSSGKTGHLEAVQVHYDRSKITYRELVDFFWRHIDPTDSGGQFLDRGAQYRSAIFYHDEGQTCRLPPGPCLPRRPATDRTSVLYQFSCVAIHSQGGFGKRGLRGICKSF